MTGKNHPKRGEVYWADLDPCIGSETRKSRPCVVISNNMGNELSHVVTIAPFTSKIKNIYPFEVKTILDGKHAKIMLNHCRSVDKSRLKNKISTIDLKTMKEVEDALRIVFELN